MTTPEQFMRAQAAETVASMVDRAALPKSLVDALDALKAAKEYEPDPAPVIHQAALTMTAADVAGVLDAAVDATIRSNVVVSIKGELVGLLARRVYREVREVAPDILAMVAEDFTQAATAFTTAHDKLPPGYDDPATLVNAGPDAVAAFAEAQQAAAELNVFRGLRETIAVQLGLTGGSGPVERGTRYAAVTNTAAAQRADQVFENGSSGGLWPWGDLLDTNGVIGLHWLTFEEQAAYIKTLPHAEDRYQPVHLGAGVYGHEMVEA